MNLSCRFLLALLGIVGLLVSARASHCQVTDWKQVQSIPLRSFQPQVPQRIQLSNGLVIFLQEDHEFPFIRGIAQIHGGSRDEAADKTGLAQILGLAWRTGGTKLRTGDYLDDYLEGLASQVETGGEIDSTTVSWNCLKENYDGVFSVFYELLRKPEFREDKVALAKSNLNTSISRRNDNPIRIALREVTRLIYGPESPYGRVPEYDTVASVTRDDLLRWHQRYVQPNNIILGVVGDFESKRMETRLREAFESWPMGPTAGTIEYSLQRSKVGLYFIQRDDVSESTIQMVGLGARRDSPDLYTIEVFNQFFGGSFGSRLYSNIRSKKGLAYAVSGGVGVEFDHPGLLQFFLGTKSSTTIAAIDALSEELDSLKANPITAQELGNAKEALLNSFVFRLDSKEKVLRERMTYEFYGYPLDFLESYRAGIEQVKQEDVARLVQKYIERNGLTILVVGNQKDFDRPLSSIGPVTTLDVSIPSPKKPRKNAS